MGLKSLPDKSIDLILTDPPYGKKADKGTNGFGAAKNRRYAGGWDGMIPPPELFNEMFRVARNLIIFGGNYFGHLLPPSNCWIFWDKKGDVAFQNPFADGELIYTTFKKPVKRIVFKQQGFITDSKDKRYHPTQKPTELVQQLIEMFSEPGQIICDPFLGSGTTAVAAVITGRHYIGYEIDPGYFQICCDRLDEVEEKTDEIK
ncbi:MULTISPECIES: site-specific DNA-methyltransferase [unclassified Neglectibacter]|uniref:site-specific DNA-methyltransferase n=1 Tax=Neglectibacter sp. 59 TaxID=2304573 RepID=UPI001A9B4DE8